MADNKDPLTNNKQKSGFDINTSLGAFAENSRPADVEEEFETHKQLDEIAKKLDTKITEKDKKINFEKFNKITKKAKSAKTNFGIWAENILNKKAWLVWIVAFSAIVVIVGLSVPMMIFGNRALSGHLFKTGFISSSVVIAAQYMNYVCYGLLCLPFIFLLTSFIVGINGVIKNKMFHYWLFGTILLSLVVILISVGFDSWAIIEKNRFWE